MNFTKSICLLCAIALSASATQEIQTCTVKLSKETSSIKEIGSFAQAQNELKNADKNTVVVFDVDGTLTYNPAQEQVYLYNNVAELPGLDQAQEDLWASTEMLKNSYILTDPGIVTRINELQARGIKIVALSAIPTGAFGKVSSARTLRFEQLQKVGIDFSSSFKKESIVFDTLNAEKGEYPMFYKGIMLTNRNNTKGQVLKEFFNRVGWTPTKVLFFDDRKKHIESVEQEMRKLGIQYCGYWYRAVEKLLMSKFDRTKAQVQLQYVLKHDEFIDIDEIKSAEAKI